MRRTPWLWAGMQAWLAAGVLSSAVAAEDEEINYDEAKVPAYTLPDPLLMQDGRPVKTAAMWRN